jgi:hypothetical protein
VAGREYLSHRYRYDDPLATPVNADEIAAADLDPPPF